MNGTHEILWDFEIQTDLLILARRSDRMRVNEKKKKKKKKKEKKNDLLNNRYSAANYRMKIKENEKRNE